MNSTINTRHLSALSLLGVLLFASSAFAAPSSLTGAQPNQAVAATDDSAPQVSTPIPQGTPPAGGFDARSAGNAPDGYVVRPGESLNPAIDELLSGTDSATRNTAR